MYMYLYILEKSAQKQADTFSVEIIGIGGSFQNIRLQIQMKNRFLYSSI